jgi:uncharacterized protein YeaO (DUF488 family)
MAEPPQCPKLSLAAAAQAVCIDDACRTLKVVIRQGVGMFKIKRAYEPADKRDGTRVLVDRVWPRGRSKEEIQIDHWLKDVAPSTSLRKRFRHDPKKWGEFKERYAAELEGKRDSVDFLLDLGNGKKPVTLVFAAKDTEHNNAVALADYLRRSGRRRSSEK